MSDLRVLNDALMEAVMGILNDPILLCRTEEMRDVPNFPEAYQNDVYDRFRAHDWPQLWAQRVPGDAQRAIDRSCIGRVQCYPGGITMRGAAGYVPWEDPTIIDKVVAQVREWRRIRLENDLSKSR